MNSEDRRREPEKQRHERIFQALPKLGSPEYMELLKTASATELPAQVLVRAFRQLADGRAADATLERLLMSDATFGYLRHLRRKAERRVSYADWFDAGELVNQAISFIAMSLRGKAGERAHEVWFTFLEQRLEDAYRSLNGRRGERRDESRQEPYIHAETGDRIDPRDSPNALHAPWHGSVEPSHLEWLENFVRRTLATISDARIREVAQDQFSVNPSPKTGTAVGERLPLDIRYGVSRFTIDRWVRAARAKLLAALIKQNECEINIDWLTRSLSDE